MAELLRTPNLCDWPETSVDTQLNLSTPAQAGKWLAQSVSAATDVLLFYYVGHGVLAEDGSLILTLSDTTSGDPEFTGLPWAWVRRSIRRSPALTKIVILDCCYAGQAIDILGSTENFADLTHIDGAYTLTATFRNGPAHVPANQAAECTSFTGELISLVRNGLPNAGPQLKMRDIFNPLFVALSDKELPLPNQRVTGTADRYAIARNRASPSNLAEIGDGENSERNAGALGALSRTEYTVKETRALVSISTPRTKVPRDPPECPVPVRGSGASAALLCDSCLKYYPAGDLRIGNDAGELVRPFFKPSVPSGRMRKRAASKADPIDLLLDDQSQHLPHCPYGHAMFRAHFHLRDEFYFSIAVIGGIASSKTTLIYAIAAELAKMGAFVPLELTVSVFEDQEAETSARISDLYGSQRRAPAATMIGEASRPLVLRFRMPNGRRFSIGLHDFAGEDLFGRRTLTHAREIVSCSAIVAVIDPAASSSTGAAFRSSNWDPLADLQRLIQIAEGFERVCGAPMDSLAIPVIVTVGKSDLVEWSDPGWPSISELGGLTADELRGIVLDASEAVERELGRRDLGRLLAGVRTVYGVGNVACARGSALGREASESHSLPYRPEGTWQIIFHALDAFGAFD